MCILNKVKTNRSISVYFKQSREYGNVGYINLCCVWWTLVQTATASSRCLVRFRFVLPAAREDVLECRIPAIQLGEVDDLGRTRLPGRWVAT